MQSNLLLTNSAFSQIVFSAWFAESKESELPDRETVSKILDLTEEVPASIRSVAQTPDQLTALIFEGQQAGLLERINPSNKEGRSKLDLVEVLNLLDQLSFEFPAEVEWVQARIKTVIG